MRRHKRELCFWVCLAISLLASFGLAWCTAVEYAAATLAAGGHPENDLGDAPDSSHGFGGLAMQAYPDGTIARYPTVYGAGSPPYGPIHWKPRAAAYLGSSVTLESEATEGADEDAVNNIGPREETSNRDGGDDGVRLPLALPSGGTTSLEYTVTVVNPAASVMYVNVWFDWNRDGDWDDLLSGSNGAAVPEWAVQNQVVALTAAGTLRLTTPSFVSWQPARGALPPIWMRITLSETAWPATGQGLVSGGCGPKDGYLYGETEDYYLSPAGSRWLDKSLGAQGVKEDAPAASNAPLWTQAAGDPAWQWSQWPDMTAGGIAVRADSSDGQRRILADDFEGATINEGVRLWGIWKNDQQGQITKIRLSVYDNDPAGAGGPDPANTFAKPGPEVLWQKEFGPDQFEQVLYYIQATNQWWWDPARSLLTRNGGTELWQITITISPEDAFVPADQPGSSQIHWLAVEVETTGGQFGWQTRRQQDHFQGAAVWDSQPILAGTLQALSSSADPWNWHTLDYPAGYPAGGGQQTAIDLGFSVKSTQIVSVATAQPGSATQCAVVSTQCPLVSTTCPAVTTRCPAVSTTCPAQSTKCPAVSTTCPAQSTKCPVVSTTCPAQSTKCPVVSTTCPAQSTRCPVVSTTCPTQTTQCPAAATQCSTVSTACSGVSTQCPTVWTLCPPASTLCPTASTQCPRETTKCPLMGTQCPPASTTCPPVATQCPPQTTACPPVVATICPAASTRCPAVPTTCPSISTQCPAQSTQCPTQTTACPASSTVCPQSTTSCPVVSTSCPPVATSCPAESTKCPESLTKCPPAVTTKCPVQSTSCPTSYTYCPASTTWCPQVHTKCPGSLTACYQVASKCPMLDTYCPEVSTKCPPVETQCPESYTKCPATPTQCHYQITTCPFIPGVCH